MISEIEADEWIDHKMMTDAEEAEWVKQRDIFIAAQNAAKEIKKAAFVERLKTRLAHSKKLFFVFLISPKSCFS